MKVVATKVGFHNGSLIQVGQEFDVPQGYRGSWFAPVDTAEAKEAKAPKKEKKQEPVALSEVNAKKQTFNEVHKGEADLA